MWITESGDKKVNVIVALISVSLSFFVVLSFLIFRKMRRSVFMMFIFFISLCDLIANASVFFPGTDESIWCFFQGIFMQYFYSVSFIWTMILTYNMYSLGTKGKLGVDIKTFHLIAWGVPLVLALLPLTTETYRSAKDDDDWCWINSRYEERDGSQFLTYFWTMVSFWIPLFLCCIACFYWGQVMIYFDYGVNNEYAKGVINQVVSTLIAYPIIIW